MSDAPPQDEIRPPADPQHRHNPPPADPAPPRPRLILDLSTSLIWEGKPSVGMVRVERELARALLARTDIESGFVHLERNRRIFREIGRERAKAIIDAVTPPVDAATARRDALRGRARKVERRASRRAVGLTSGAGQERSSAGRCGSPR